MSKILLSVVGGTSGAGWRRANQWTGFYSPIQDRVELGEGPSDFSGLPQMVVEEGGLYLHVVTTVFTLVYAGPADGFDFDARALAVPPGFAAGSVEPGWVVYARRYHIF